MSVASDSRHDYKETKKLLSFLGLREGPLTVVAPNSISLTALLPHRSQAGVGGPSTVIWGQGNGLAVLNF